MPHITSKTNLNSPTWYAKFFIKIHTDIDKTLKNKYKKLAISNILNTHWTFNLTVMWAVLFSNKLNHSAVLYVF